MPNDAKNWKEVKTITVHWYKGGPVEYKRDDPVLGVVIASSVCFDVKEMFDERGENDYTHEGLTTLIKPSSYAAPRKYDVEKILEHRNEGTDKEYLVKWQGFRVTTWIKHENTQDCAKKVKKYNDQIEKSSEKSGEGS